MSQWTVEPIDKAYDVKLPNGVVILRLELPGGAVDRAAFEAAVDMVRMLPELHELYVKIVHATHKRANVEEAEEEAVEARKACNVAVKAIDFLLARSISHEQ